MEFELAEVRGGAKPPSGMAAGPRGLPAAERSARGSARRLCSSPGLRTRRQLRQLCVPRLFSLKEERSGCNEASYCSSHRMQQQPLTTWYEACPASQPGAHLCWDTAGPGQQLQTAWGSSCHVCWVMLQTRVCLGLSCLALLCWHGCRCLWSQCSS